MAPLLSKPVPTHACSTSQGQRAPIVSSVVFTLPFMLLCKSKHLILCIQWHVLARVGLSMSAREEGCLMLILLSVYNIALWGCSVSRARLTCMSMKLTSWSAMPLLGASELSA